MKLLRETIRNLILEIDDDDDYIGMTPEQLEQYEKYHNVERAAAAIDEITDIFKFKDCLYLMQKIFIGFLAY